MPRALRAAASPAGAVVAVLVTLVALLVLVAGSALAPSAYADDPPIETESPGGATCLPGGPTQGCAPDQTDRPDKPKHRKSPSATPARTSAPSVRATPTRTTPKPERTRTATATTPASTTSAPAPRTTPTVAPASSAAVPPPAETPQASAVAVQSALPEDGAPGWVGPVATALLVLLAGVLLVGPLRRRFGTPRSSDGGPPATT